MVCLSSWCGAYVVMMTIVCCFSSLDPGEQAQVSTAMDVADYSLTTLQKVFQEQAATLEELKNAGDFLATQKYMKLVSMASNVGNALKLLGAAASVASFVFTFFMPSPMSVLMDLINERFKEVNYKLDLLDAKLDAIEKSLKSNTAFNVFLSKFIEWKYDSDNGAKMLKEVREAIGQASTREAKMKLAHEFVTHYESNNLDGNTQNLYRMAALPEDELHRNIFDRFIDEYGCDITMLVTVMTKIKHLMTSAGIQKLTYYHFKGDGPRAYNGFQEIQKYMYDIRRAFQYRVFKCHRDVLFYAKKDVDKILKKPNIKDVAQETIVSAVYDKLSESYPLYTWAVASVMKDGETYAPWKGRTFFTVDFSENRQIVAVIEDAKLQLGCSDIDNAKTLLTFMNCDGCKGDFVRAGKNFLTDKKCGSSILAQVVDVTKLQPLLEFTGRTMHYIASTVNSDINECETTERCNNRGLCKPIPYTKDVQCICYDYYSGANCEKRDSFDDSILKKLASLRQKFGIYTGVPNVVDVFHGIKTLSQKLDSLLKKIQSSFAHTQNIIKHSDIIYKVENVVDIYNLLQRGAIDFNEFGGKLDRYFTSSTTPFELQNRLKKMILGQGALDAPGRDIFNTFKSEYVSKYSAAACSAEYNEAVSSLMESLLYLDYTLGETLMLHQQWLLETSATDIQLKNRYVKKAEDIRKQFEDRPKLYMDYWLAHSCGDLTIRGTNANCKKRLTYGGMSIRPVCDHQRKARPDVVTCQQQANSALTWSDHPVCKYVWGPFSLAWSACSRSCGGGTKRRYRTCQGTSDVSKCRMDSGGSEFEEKKCNERDCCDKYYGKYKCGNGKCLPLSRTCDGKIDCNNAEDESDSQCSNALRSGFKVALKALGTGKNMWLQKNGDFLNFFTDCPGTSFDQEDKTRCPSALLTIHVFDRPKGSIVQEGDKVAIQYLEHGRVRRMRCRTYKCFMCTCAGDSESRRDIYRIYTEGNTGYVQKDDQVFLKMDSEGNAWFSHKLELGVFPMPYGGSSCPGFPLRGDASSACPNSVWKLTSFSN